MNKKTILFFPIFFIAFLAAGEVWGQLKIVGNQQMLFNENQTLTVEGGLQPYTWFKSSGGGSLSGSSGTSVIFTAPSSNPNCAKTVVEVKDGAGETAIFEIMATLGPIGLAYYVVEMQSDDGVTLRYISSTSYHCDGITVTGYSGTMGCYTYPPPGWCSECQPDCEIECFRKKCCPWDGFFGCIPGIYDVRSDYMREIGCCPVALDSPPTLCEINISNSAGVIDPAGGGKVDFSGNISDPNASWSLSIGGQIFSGSGGEISAPWNGRDERGKFVKPGDYTATLTIEGGACSGQTKDIPVTISGNKEDLCLQVHIGSSVNIASGNLRHSQGLFTVPQGRFSREFVLAYNSFDGRINPLGTGWTHTYNIRLEHNNNGSYTLLEGDGTKIVIYLKGDRYTPEKSNYPALTVSADGTSLLEKKEGIFYQFDGNGRITRILDRNSNAVMLTYDAQNNLVLITDSSGRNISLAYNEDNRIQTVIDPMGNTHSFSYSGQHLSEIVSSTLRGEVQKWVYSYDENGFMLSKTDPLGYVTAYNYDPDHRLSRVIDPEGRSRSVSYDPSHSMSQITEKDGGIWTYQYDSRMGVLTARIDPLAGTETYGYDENRNIIRATDPNGHVTQYEYDANANVTLIQDPLGGIATYAYNELNKVTSRTDPLGNIIRFTYDPRGNLISVTDPIGEVSNFSYDSRGNIIKDANARGFETKLVYDERSYLTSVTDATGSVMNFGYDPVGNLINAIDPMGNVNRFEYSRLNRLLKMTDPLGNVTTNAYDALGNRTSLQDANGKATFYEYNYNGQVIAIKDALGNVTRAAYGGAACPSCGGGVDRLTSLTDANGNKTAYQYDRAGRLISATDPLGNVTAYSYDSAGNLVSKTDANGHTILYAYDALDQLIEKTYPDGTKEAFEYDANGSILHAGNKDISYNFIYDNNGRVINVVDSNGRMIQYQYDALGNRLQMTPSEGGPTDYRYDANNRLSEIIAPGGSYRFAYDALGRRMQMILPNGTSVDYSHDPGSRLINLSHKNSGGSLIDQFAYTHDGVGNRLTKTQTDVQYAYSYDATYQLTQALPNPLIEKKLERFSYDPVGNRLTGPKNRDFYTYDKGNQLIEDRRLGYEHDKNGNLIKKTLTDADGRIKIFAYDYDYENRLVKVEIKKADEAKVVTFAYDPFGRRISKSILRQDLLEDGDDVQVEDPTQDLPGITQFVYDHEDIILEYNRRGKVNARYIHGLGIDEPLAVEKKGNIYYYHTDGLGSITALTDDLGQIVQQYEYDSFGRITKYANLPRQPYTFTGREWDQETGLYYYRARYYDPRTGRFLTRDPIGFGGGDMNVYRYVQNDPINFSDPWGLYGWDVHYYKTYIWAREAGIDQDTAQAIAEANQSVDELIFQDPHSFLSLLVGGLWFHFPNRGTTELELMKCSKFRQVESFGRQLHMLQDSFSHAGISPLTHLKLGHTPDEYSEYNPRDRQMAQLTKWYLKEFKKSLDNRPFR